MDLDEEPDAGYGQLKASLYACDSCRHRKVKCDERDPCTQCSTAGKQCRRTHVAKPREKRQRVLVSTQYEQKIDRIEAQIQILTGLIQDIRQESTLSRSLPQTRASEATRISLTPADTPDAVSQAAEASYEGESSLAAHSRFANDFLELSFRNGRSPQHNESLTALRQLTTAAATPQPYQELVKDRPDPVASPAFKYDLPSFTAVAALLKTERGNISESYSQWLTTITSPAALTQHCMDVYFTPTYTDAQLIITAGNLYWLFADRAAALHEPSHREENHKNAALCRAALEMAVARLPLNMPLNMDSLLALVTGAMHAIGIAKPVLAWTLVSRASELAQSLGMHRAASTVNRSRNVPETRVPIFWLLYILDKGLSLRLGRASTIQDYDVDLPRGLFGPYLNHFSERHVQYANLWLNLARVQGDVYKDLYSPWALTLSREAREATAEKVAGELYILRAELDSICDFVAKKPDPDVRDTVIIRTDQVVIECMLTLAYRAIPPEAGSTSIFHSSCLNAARSTLESHQRCMSTIKPDDAFMLEIYINWSLLQTPFIPFIVVFCNVIETNNEDDLAHLNGFLETLETARSMSQPMEKAYRLFQVLCNIAQQSVESHRAGLASLQLSSGDDGVEFYPADGAVAMAAFGRPLQQRESLLSGESAPMAWSAEQQQMFDNLQDDALQLLGTNFMSDVGRYYSFG